MTPKLETFLATAYHTAIVGGDHVAAAATLGAHLAAEPALGQEAAAECNRLKAVVGVRQMGGQSGDHVSAVLYELLAKAIGG